MVTLLTWICLHSKSLHSKLKESLMKTVLRLPTFSSLPLPLNLQLCKVDLKLKILCVAMKLKNKIYVIKDVKLKLMT